MLRRTGVHPVIFAERDLDGWGSGKGRLFCWQRREEWAGTGVREVKGNHNTELELTTDMGAVMGYTRCPHTENL